MTDSIVQITDTYTDPNGLYQMRARYYNPEIKRFVNRDVVTGSIGNGLTMNCYAYVNGNLVSYIDPFGLSADGAEWLKQGGSFVADAIPFVGTAKGIQEVFTGVDVITGQQLSVTDRVAAGGGTLLSWLPGGKVAGKWAVKGTASGGTWLIGKLGKIGKIQVNEIEVAEKQSLRLKLDLQLFAGNGSSLAQKIEDNAALQLSKMESATPNAHFYSRHGSQTTLAEQYLRATTGVTPDGYHLRPVNSSRFSSNQAQLNSAQRSETIYRQTRANKINFSMDDIIGEGYKRGGQTYIKSSKVVAIFRNDQLYTMYPDLN
ncbi:pre-toxin TG domain-containing protein [Paenibacillus hunanensis]|uniref:pre-toxin TG domain-containing protein n=1 Tax=Paenibacillus hunanensis TaxID=539262 RepID=UPI00202622BC|nr:pre-toxin TG domain-containing protein [Paenibacillus hunanensis]MCL9663126.1 pre-toxin TG domain-containing protein [Paenibacillus hunanensis]